MSACLSHPSPNFGARRDGAVPRLIVIHYTAMTSAEAALERLCDPEAEVSCHWLVGADGSLSSLVEEEMRAWHAGMGGWRDCTDINSASIGVELDNDGASPFPEAQMAALERLLGEIMERWSIPPAGVLGHSDTAFTRKSDPGPRFDWRRLARSDLAVWPDADRGTAGELSWWHDFAASFGYRIYVAETEDCGDPEAAAFHAFRTRFRPGYSGPLDVTDLRLAQDLARRFSIDPLRGAT